MKKRSAMAIAAGIVAALLAGAISLTAGFSGSGLASATSAPDRVEPRVRTIERTITIHKQAKAEAAPVDHTVVAPAPATAVAPASATDDRSTSGDDAFDDDEHEDGELDDQDDDAQSHEDEEHADEDDGEPEDD